jgi:DNA polymerase elongation subunit (family B)
MAKIKFYPADIVARNRFDKASLDIYGRTDSGERILVVYSGFRPYFWAVLSPELEPEKEFEFKNNGSSAHMKYLSEKAALYDAVKVISIRKEDNSTVSVSGIEIAKKHFLGRDVEAVKVFCNFPSDIDELYEHIKLLGFTVFESDIPSSKKFLLDNDITPFTLCEAEGDFVNQKSRVPVFKADSILKFSDELMPNFKILAFDIESYNPNGKITLPEKDPIVMCSFYAPGFEKVLTWQAFPTDEKYIEFVKDERELLERFKQIVVSEKPDLLTGYFSDGFDLPYIKKRAEVNNVELDIGLDYSALMVKSGRISTCRIIGIPHIDTFRFVKNIISRSLETSYLDLDSVAHELLDERKEDVDIGGLASAWKSSPEKLEAFCRYNLKDSILTYNILDKSLPNLLELMKIVRLSPFDVSRMSMSQIVEWYLIREAKNFNELVPNKPSASEVLWRKSQTYPGAFVFEPQPGFYKDIVVFDFRSLYPSIITTHNISPDTVNCRCCKDEKESIEDMNNWFCQKKKGFISTVIADVITRRMRVKEIMKSADEKDRKLLKAREQALKTIANSMYGYMGFFAARWYSIESTRSITAYGRYYIKHVIDNAIEQGFKVLYSDTDSVFFALGEKKREDADAFLHQINRDLPGMMEMDIEDFYPSGIFVSAKAGAYGAKKKYALLSEKGKIKIRGFETVRRNWSLIGKEVQEQVLNIILREGDGNKAFSYVKEVIDKMMRKEIPPEKLIIFTQLQKEIESYASVGPHVAVAKRMKELGKVVGPGTVIPYIVTEGKGKIRDRAKLPEETAKDSYDAEYYINNQIIPTVGKLLEVMGYSTDELIEGGQVKKSQSSLNSFFK